MPRATRRTFKPYVDSMRKEIAGWSISKYLESPNGVSTQFPQASMPKIRVSRRLFKIEKDKFEKKEGGWSIARKKESEI